MEELETRIAELREATYKWVDVFAEGVKIKELVAVDKIHTTIGNIAGIDIPRNKQVAVSLQYIYGIGPSLSQKILADTNVNPETNVDDLTDEEVNRIREAIDRGYRVEGDLRKEINLNVRRLIEIGSYRGIRHQHGLPLRGQRTRTNARTKRGPRKTVAGRGQRRGMAKK